MQVLSRRALKRRCLFDIRHFCRQMQYSNDISREELLNIYQDKQLRGIVSLRGTRPVKMQSCPETFENIHGRKMWDNVTSKDDCNQAVEYARQAMGMISGHDGNEWSKLFPPDVPEAALLLGPDGFQHFNTIFERVHENVKSQFGPDLFPVNYLISWITGENQNPNHTQQLQSFDVERDLDWIGGTYGPHVDVANQPDYDVSALLYLSTMGTDFEGGYFSFNDADADRFVEPTAGRLIAFPSGFDNMHHVRPVVSGERFVLSIWYSYTMKTRLPMM